jgi:methyl-accepting chemotaxis protein
MDSSCSYLNSFASKGWAMGSIFGTGAAQTTSGPTAAREAVNKARAALQGRNPDLVLLYCSSDYRYDEVLQAVRRETNDAPLIGASTAGAFTADDVGANSVAVGLFALDEIRFFTGLAEGIDRSPEQAVSRIISNIPVDVAGYPHRTVLLLADGMVGNGEEITLLVGNAAGPNTRVVGGLAADDFKMERTVVFHNDQVAEKAAAICLMASKKPMFTAVCHGHRPLGVPRKITRAEGNVLYELDDRPAWDVWKEQTSEAAKKLGIDVQKVEHSGQLTAFLTNFEMGLRIDQENYKMRFPIATHADGSMTFSCSIPTGSTIAIMDGSDHEQQIAASRRAAEDVLKVANAGGFERFAGALVIECAVRRFLLGDRFDQAPAAIRDVLGTIPMLGAATYGEMRLEPSEYSGYHNTTTVLLLLPE